MIKVSTGKNSPVTSLKKFGEEFSPNPAQYNRELPKIQRGVRRKAGSNSAWGNGCFRKFF
jgi:hypothetical protein